MRLPQATSPWTQLATCRPTRSPDCLVQWRTQRGVEWVIVRNEANGTHVRVSRSVWELVERFDGCRTVAEAVADLDRYRCANGREPVADDPSSQERLAAGLLTLERAGLFATGGGSAAERLWLLGKAAARAARRSRWSNPLALRFPLHDPDRWLDRMQPALDRVSLRALGSSFIVMAILCLTTLFTQWPRLAADLSAMASAPHRWWTLLLVWPLLKLAHESAHALTVRKLGGRVHEVGLGFLVLMPMPYVDASDASLFELRRDRALVSAAGMLAETLIAMAALLMWCLIEPGLLRELLLSIVITGTLSTVLFNANPLLRFDGYHLLQDLADLPNLSSRSQAYWREQARTRWLGLPPRDEQQEEADERRWLACYGVLATAYRFLVIVAIAWWLIDVLPLLGVPLALYALWPLVVRPLIVALRWIATTSELDGRRLPAMARVLAPVAVIGIAVVVVPLPSSTRVAGIVVMEDSKPLSAPESGTLIAVARPGRLDVGAPLLRIDAPELVEEAKRLDARIASVAAARAQASASDPLEARMLARERDVAIAARADLTRRIESLDLRAPGRGRFVAGSDGLLLGRDVTRGAPLGQFVQEGALSVRAALDEAAIGRLREGVTGSRIRLVEAPLDVLAGTALVETPSAQRHLPSPALAGDGVDGIAVASVEDGFQTRDPVFHVDVGLPPDARVTGIGGRAFVTFRHAPEPLARRWWRTTRRLFLERLAI